jgi:hypothetical protein
VGDQWYWNMLEQNGDARIKDTGSKTGYVSDGKLSDESEGWRAGLLENGGSESARPKWRERDSRRGGDMM